jgi:hypothetical protein
MSNGVYIAAHKPRHGDERELEMLSLQHFIHFR